MTGTGEKNRPSTLPPEKAEVAAIPPLVNSAPETESVVGSDTDDELDTPVVVDRKLEVPSVSAKNSAKSFRAGVLPPNKLLEVIVTTSSSLVKLSIEKLKFAEAVEAASRPEASVIE